MFSSPTPPARRRRRCSDSTVARDASVVRFMKNPSRRRLTALALGGLLRAAASVSVVDPPGAGRQRLGSRLPARAGRHRAERHGGGAGGAAARIGADILQKGGNAVDAAVAVGFALGRDLSARRQSRRRRLHGDPSRRRHRHRPSTIARPRRAASTPRAFSTRKAMPTRRSRAIPRSPSACPARSPASPWPKTNTAPAASPWPI